DLDTPFATGTNRIGIKVDGPLTGNVDNAAGAVITIVGNNSTGIQLNGPLTGNLSNLGSLAVTGDNAVGISTQAVSGDLRVTGAIDTTGKGATSIIVGGDVGGGINIANDVTTTGYRYITRPATDAALAKLDADDLLQGGPSMVISGNVAKGVIVSRPPSPLSDTVADLDGDGIPDTDQTTGAISSYGSAPALIIGSTTQDITLGQVVTGGSGHGLIVNGIVGGNGDYEGFAANGLQIGAGSGKAVTIDGGIANGGTISAIARAAPATALVIQPGSKVESLTNTGAMNASVIGDAAFARTVVDQSGSLHRIDNSGSIRAAISDTATTGVRTAIDVSAATTGVTITQTQSTVVTTAPLIVGNVLLGAHDDILNVQAGGLAGDISFGAGADRLTIGNKSAVIGVLTDSDGALSVDVASGSLQMAQSSGVLNATSVHVGADSTLLFTADSKGLTAGTLSTGTAAFDKGAKIGLTVNGYLAKDSTFTVLTAGSLTNSGLVDVSTSTASYLFTSTAKVNPNSIDLTVRRRTGAELGFTKGEATSADAVYNYLASSTGPISSAILHSTTQQDLLFRYDQLMPDQGENLFTAMEGTNLGLADAVAQRPDPGATRYGPDSFWLREVDLRDDRDRGDTLGGETKGFGISAGYEAMGFGDGGALGFTLSYMNAQANDASAQVGEYVSSDLWSGGAYWRGAISGLTYDFGGQAGTGRMKGIRRLVSPLDGLNDTAKGQWNVKSLSAFGSVSYEQRLGRYFIRPSVNASYLRLAEDAYTETGAASDFNLAVSRRTSSRVVAEGLVALGSVYGVDGWWRPEIRLGYRTRTGGKVGETTARFQAGGSSFTLPAVGDQSAPVFGIALRAGSGLSYVSIETEAEFDEDATRYQVNLFGRVMF
ncbi:MAG: autotransporter, partial [Caulobacteraceae bacterium]|nr:autotransporter [Caulobacteraceae bacterium]